MTITLKFDPGTFAVATLEIYSPPQDDSRHWRKT